MKLRIWMMSAAIIATATITTHSFGEEPAEAAPNPVQFSGFVDGYYAWNSNDPDSHENFDPGTGTTAKRSDEFALNLASIEVSREAKPLGFKLSLVAGNGTEIVHAGEPQGAGTGPDTYENIYEAWISYKPTEKLMIKGGVFPSHIGFEGFYSKDNWNYTRSWLGEFSPYYQAGVHAGYQFTDHWSGEVHVLNGWQIIGDNNDSKAIGGKIAYSGERLNASLSTFNGPELADNDDDWRHFGNILVLWKATPRLSVGGSLDRGHQECPDSAAADWTGIAGYARYTLNDRSAIALRAEQFDDPDNGISGTAQKLREATLTFEYRPVDRLILKLEARHDSSTEPVFQEEDDSFSKTETLIILGAVATF
ncbi:MAG: porin [Acidobacteria bacterium]|nr:porin [Acidobacteriota bacterium]